MATLVRTPPARPGPLAALVRGFHASWTTLLLVLAINTGIAAVLWIDDTRPFWHPLMTVQTHRLLDRLLRQRRAAVGPRATPCGAWPCAVAIGVADRRRAGHPRQGLLRRADYRRASAHALNLFFGTTFRRLRQRPVASASSSTFKFREARAAAALHKAEAERHLLSKQAIEAELKLMQAQVEPHFLFNTLASVQYLTETDPQAGRLLLGHLIDYLRAALPQLRASSTTLGKEVGLADGVSQHPADAHGRAADVRHRRSRRPGRASVPAEPADLARRERDQARRRARGRRRHDHASSRAHAGDALVVTVTDTGRGGAAGSRGPPATASGLANMRERLAALYGDAGPVHARAVDAPRGTRATLSMPLRACALEAAPTDAHRADCRGRAAAARATEGAACRGVAGTRGDRRGRQRRARRWRCTRRSGRTSCSSTSGCRSSPGIDVAHALAGRCHVVFVTAYDEYAVAAFDEGAVDYVLKPVTPERIAKVVARLKSRLASAPLDLSARAGAAGGARGQRLRSSGSARRSATRCS